MSSKTKRYNNRNKQRSRNKQKYTVSSSSSNAQSELDLSADQIALIAQFSSELETLLSSHPHTSSNNIDMSLLTRRIAENSQLSSVLRAIQQREDAREAAMLYDTKSAPAASFSQAANVAASKWGGSKDDEPVGVTNHKLLRRWAEENVWVRAAIDIRRGQIEGMKPVCIPNDPKKRYDKKIQQKIQNILNRPNERRDSWRTLIGPVLEDILTLDRGAIVKNMTLDRKPIALYFADGATIKIYPAWDGNAKTPRYLYESPDGKEKVPLRNDECIMMVSKSASHRVSLSPIQTLQQTIVADIEATITAARLGKLKPPPNAIQIPGETPTKIAQMADDYSRQIAGKKELFFFGGKEAAHLFPLVFSAKDNQLLEWQIYLGRKIAIIFQISPQKLGILHDVNRANGEVQQEIDEDRGLIPLLLLIEEYLNVEVLGDYAPLDMYGLPELETLNLKIVFPEVSDAARKLHAQETVNMASKALTPNMPSMTLNDIRVMLGEEPVEGGDTFYVNTMSGPMKWLSYDEPLESMPQNISTTPPDEASDVVDDTGDDTADKNAKGSSSSQNTDTGDDAKKGSNKMYLGRYDSRSPGKSWSPSVNGAIKTLTYKETGQTGKTKIPEKFIKESRKAPDLQHHETVLNNAVKRLFDNASDRGNRALQRLEHSL